MANTESRKEDWMDLGLIDGDLVRVQAQKELRVIGNGLEIRTPFQVENPPRFRQGLQQGGFSALTSPNQDHAGKLGQVLAQKRFVGTLSVSPTGWTFPSGDKNPGVPGTLANCKLEAAYPPFATL
jgi:hypothetical protein